MTQQERQEKSRNLIYQAALEEFGNHGYDNVSMEQICSRHSISKGMMYHYFRGKDDLFLYAVHHVFEELKEYLEKECLKLSDLDALEAIKGFLLARERFFQNREREKVLFECAIFHNPKGLSAELDKARCPLKDLNRNFLISQVDRMKLKKGLDRTHVYRYISSIDYIFQGLLRNYEESEDLTIHDMLKDAGELISMMLFGVVEY